MAMDTLVSDPEELDIRGAKSMLSKLKRYKREFAPDSNDVGVAGIYNTHLGAVYRLMSKEEADERIGKTAKVDNVVEFYPTSYFEERLAALEKNKGRYKDK